MNVPSSTQLPIPTFQQADNSSPAVLLELLQTLLHNFDNDPTFNGNSNQAWFNFFSELSKSFFSTFPTPQEFPWSTIHGTLKLTDTLLEVISRATERVERLFFDPEGFSEDLFLYMLKACTTLDIWCDVPVPPEEDYPTPEVLREKFVHTCIGMMRSLGSDYTDAKDAEATERARQTLRRLLTECLAGCNDLLALTPATEFPLIVALFSTPRPQDKQMIDGRKPVSDESRCIRIDSPLQIPTFLTSLIELCINTLCPARPSQWFLSDLVRSFVLLCRQTFDFLFSPSCNTTSTRRARSLMRLCIATRIAQSIFPDFERTAEYIASRSLLHRLYAGPDLAWTDFDAALQKEFEAPLAMTPFIPDIQGVVTVLRTECWEEAGNGLRALAQSYLRLLAPQLEDETLQVIKDALGTEERAAAYDSLLHVVNTRLALLKALKDGAAQGPTRIDPLAWKSAVRVNVQAIIEPDELAWMDDDGSFTDAQYIARAQDEIERRFERPLYNPAAKARETLAQELGRLPCTIVHSAQPACHAASNKSGVSTLPIYMLVCVKILEGPADEVTALVRKAVYDALCRTLRHHAASFGGGRLERIAEMIGRGMKDQERTVRLGAGRALVELVRLHQSIGSGVGRRTEPLFTMLYRIFETSNDCLRETTLITVGQIGRTTNADVLGQSVCCLIAQLGHQNPIMKGTTHMQLQALVKHHKRTPYRLVLPYLDQIAPFLVSRMCTHPALLSECCRFVVITPADFIRFTLPRTLPQLFASCDVKVLEAITAETGEKPHGLFIMESHAVLAYAFLLPRPGQTNKVVNFILSVLKQAAGNAPIDVTSVVRSCIVPLLTELVIVMGDDDPEEAKTAMQALVKVERHMNPPRTHSRGGTSPGNIGAFLKPYMLGIMTALNDFLQEPQGRRPPEFKKKILRSLGPFVTQIGPAVTNIAPQIMATLQTMLVVSELSDVTLQSWLTFLGTLEAHDIGPHVGPTSASIVVYWATFTHHGRDLARQCLEFMIQKGQELGAYLDEFVSLESIPQLTEAKKKLVALRKRWKPRDTLQRILERSASESVTVALQSLRELKSFLHSDQEDFVRALASGDVFDPLIGQITAALFTLACRDGEGAESLRALAFDCIGALGAVDPDRFEIGISDSRIIMLRNFTDESESVTFALHLIRDILVSAFRSTSDIKYQNHLAYAIQELLRFCKFTPALVSPETTTSIPIKVRNRWNGLPKYVLETVTPLLESRFNLTAKESPSAQHPIYLTRQTYREWIQSWTSHLITRASGEQARTIFLVFPAVVRNKDVGVAHHLLPHLVLNVMLSEHQDDAQNIRQEILSVLEDQVDPASRSSADKKLLSAQTVFMLMDHLNQWVRAIRQDISIKKIENKKALSHTENRDEEQLIKIDSILSSIDQGLMAKAALQCKAYARSFMNFEQQVITLRQDNPKGGQLHEYYERLHEIYANLDEPDGMEGVSTLIVSPSLEHQIRQHESTGRWTSAQSCWEVRLQHDPDNLDFHLGLLRCLRNLGHYDTLRTHVKGVLTRNPSWEPQLVGFQVESEWMIGNWSEVQTLVGRTKATAPPILLAQVLLALREGETSELPDALSNARKLLGAPIVAHGAKGYRRSYDAVLNLHLVHELEVIYDVVTNLPLSGSKHHTIFEKLSRRLSSRFDCTLPIFRTREPILSMRRTAFALSGVSSQKVKTIIGHSWLASSKIARKAGHWQTAYSAMLQAQQCKDPFSFMESARLIKANGEPLRALQELENSMHLFASTEADVIDLTEDKDDLRMKAKLQVLRARWMNDSDRFDLGPVFEAFTEASKVSRGWESGHFHLGQFQDDCFKALPHEDKRTRGTLMNLSTVRSFAKAAKYGSKYTYQTIPRLLTLWLDMGEDPRITVTSQFARVNQEIGSAIKNVPAYKWFTAFPQIVSRVGHINEAVYKLLADLITRVIAQYPKQALWFFASVVKSKSQSLRVERGMVILNYLRSMKNSETPRLVSEILGMTEELLALCDYSVREDRKTLSMSKDFQKLHRLAPSKLLIPLQESLTASLPPTSSTSDFTHATHEPFPVDAPTFTRFYDEIEVMRSLAKPRKITIQGSNGQTYMFLGKPKDDLRKDARLMDFNGILNKLLKTNSESRRRQLRIRTYGVVTLNEECGFIQWVPNTIPVRPILTKSYDRRNIKGWSNELGDTFLKLKLMEKNADVAKGFETDVLSKFPPVFHEWFIETFPEPTAWLASRLAYSRTAAVMSMIGFILGLGDRHCENILLDMNTGDVVHVDFNCLFEKGKTLETPERVPFRLTQNIIDGFGVTGVEGVFRIACEVTMQLLRDNKDCLMSVLDAFVHDPLVEWEDEKRKRDREAQRNRNVRGQDLDGQKKNAVRGGVDLRELAKGALQPIEKKLKGIYTTSRERPEKQISTSNLVQMLIEEATDSANLGRMYPGWASWH